MPAGNHAPHPCLLRVQKARPLLSSIKLAQSLVSVLQREASTPRKANTPTKRIPIPHEHPVPTLYTDLGTQATFSGHNHNGSSALTTDSRPFSRRDKARHASPKHKKQQMQDPRQPKVGQQPSLAQLAAAAGMQPHSLRSADAAATHACSSSSG